MRVLSMISLIIAAAIFTYLIGATLGSPVQFADQGNTAVPDAEATTQVVFADEPVTVESVTQRGRQDGEDGEDGDDDDATTVAPAASTKAPVPPPRTNESTVLTEFNFVSQPVAPVAVVPVGEEAENPTQAPAEQSQDNDESENEINSDDPLTTTDKTTFQAEYKYTVEKFIKVNKKRGSEEIGKILHEKSSTNISRDGRAGCECGKLPFKIPISEQSRINPSPWMAAIVRGGLFAGGRPHCSLINNLYVLTSASCMSGMRATSLQVWLTAHDTFEQHQASFGNVKVNVQEIIKHPNFDGKTKDNDLALLKLSSPVDIGGSSYFVPACLPAGNFNFAGTIGQVTGWSDGRNYKMCKAEMPILDNKICNRDSRHSGKITANMVCAGFLTPTRIESCIGDAGGPLISPNGGQSTLVGVVSWGYEAKLNDYSPTVYTRVSEFADFILHNTQDADWCMNG